MRAKAAVDAKPRLGARFQTLLRGNTAAKLPGNISMFFSSRARQVNGWHAGEALFGLGVDTGFPCDIFGLKFKVYLTFTTATAAQLL